MMCLLVYRGQYSDAVLSELENQNDQQLEGMSAKVKMLKDVRFPQSPTTFCLYSVVVFRFHSYKDYRIEADVGATRSQLQSAPKSAPPPLSQTA